jgi:hypothetical protein
MTTNEKLYFFWRKTKNNAMLVFSMACLLVAVTPLVLIFSYTLL